MHLRLTLLATLAVAFFTARLSASTPTADPLVLSGLQTCVSNGVESGVRAWYPDRPELGSEMSAMVVGATLRLGAIVDTEIVAIQSVSKRVTRYYVAIYFTRSPLWIRIERYQNGEKTFLLPLKCSTNPDDILPGYVTDFLR